jgi:hypothetical protein
MCNAKSICTFITLRASSELVKGRVEKSLPSFLRKQESSISGGRVSVEERGEKDSD